MIIGSKFKRSDAMQLASFLSVFGPLLIPIGLREVIFLLDTWDWDYSGGGSAPGQPRNSDTQSLFIWCFDVANGSKSSSFFWPEKTQKIAFS